MEFPLLAKTQFGLEEILAEELRELGAMDIFVLNRAVKFKGDQALMYKANLHLRCAIKILKPIYEFDLRNEDELYEGIRKFDWSTLIDVDDTFAIDGTVSSDYFSHSKYVALKTKDAIADQFRDTFGRRPNVDTEQPDLRINVHIAGNHCTVSLDSTGHSLAKRGYRQVQARAPISEVLAAGIIKLSGWDGTTDFLDPMCGSGTFPIEAAMMAINMAPGSNRTFTFENWKDHDSRLWSSIRRKAKNQIKKTDVRILGRDMDFRVINVARDNADKAGVREFIDFKVEDFLSDDQPEGEFSIFINPPYGERLSNPNDIVNLYKAVGDQMKQTYTGSEAWIISSDIMALKKVGLRPSRRIKLFNGPLECRLFKFEMYAGSKKTQKYGPQDSNS